MATVTLIGDKVIVPIVPSGQIMFSRDGEYVNIERRYYAFNDGLNPRQPDKVTMFTVPPQALRDILRLFPEED